MRYAIQLFRLLFRSAQRLFHMLVGLVFLVLAVGGVSASVSYRQEYLEAPSTWNLIRFVSGASFTVGLFILCLYTLFAKARSVR